MRVATSLYSQTPRAFSHEKRDCGVRALRVAANIDYEGAHDTLRSFGRVDGRGTWNVTMRDAAGRWGLYPVIEAGGIHTMSCPTIAQFARAHRTGRYVLRINKHFVALVNGVLHNWSAARDGVRSRVVAAWGRP